jgi:uncharacterized protein YutE (UPF0331/DUF86 family)
MAGLPKQILIEKDNVEKTLVNLKKAIERPEISSVELAAIGTFLHNIYNGIENILKQTLRLKNFNIPTSDSWRKDLLNLSVSKGIISEELSNQLYEYLTFRHFFVHSYGFMLEESHLKGLATDIYDIWPQFMAEISNTTTFNNDSSS